MLDFHWFKSLSQRTNISRNKPSPTRMIPSFVNIDEQEKQKPWLESHCNEIIGAKPLQQIHYKEAIAN